MHPISEQKVKLKDMIDQNIKNISHLIKQSMTHVKKAMALSDKQCLELAIAFTFLRRIDCLIGQYAEESYQFYSENREKLSDKQLDKNLKETSGGYNFYNVSSYTFEGFLNSGLFVEVALNSYIQGFSSNVRNILSDMGFQQNVAVLLRQSKYLVDLFEFFSELNLSDSAFSNKRFIGLITTIASDGSRKSGLFPTPIGLSKLMCDCLFCEDACEGLVYDIPDMSIYDPVCGTGSLLAYAGEKAKGLSYNGDVYLIGKEISTFSCAIANALVLLTGDEYSFAADVNTLTEDEFDEMEFRFVVADLPFGLPWTPVKERIEKENQKENGRFWKGLPSNLNDSQFLFIQDIVSKMDSMGGRAAFITSSYVLQGGSVKSGEARIRMWLIESGLVETIIALPAGILSPYTNIPVYLWILTCNEDPTCNKFSEKLEGKVRLIDATKLVSSKKQYKLDDAFIDSVYKEYKSLKNTIATQIVNKEDFGFYELKIAESGKKETVRFSLNTNIHDYIEKERKPYSKGDIIIEFSTVEKGYSVDFSKFFKSEETPVASIEDESNRMLSVMDTINSIKNDIETVVHRCTDTSVSDVWQEIPLYATTEIIQANNRSHVVDMRGMPIISMAYLRGEKVDEELYAVTHISKRVSSTDVIIVRTGANAGEVFKGVDGILSPTLAAIRCTDESLILPNYLYYLLKGYEKTLRSMTSGTTIKTLSTKSIMDFKCLIPSIEEQAKIATFLDEIISKIDNIIKIISSPNSVFSQYRQTLIENAVRGRIRLI